MKPYFLYSEKQLVALLIERDKDCFEHVFKRYAQSLYIFMRRGVDVKAECEMVVQEVFESLWSRQGILENVTMLNADLYRMTSRKLIWHILEMRVNQNSENESIEVTESNGPSDYMLTRYLQDDLTPEERRNIEDWMETLQTADASNLQLTDEEIDKLFSKTVGRIEIQESLPWRPVVEPPKSLWTNLLDGVFKRKSSGKLIQKTL